jgi:hypothetical protein
LIWSSAAAAGSLLSRLGWDRSGSFVDCRFLVGGLVLNSGWLLVSSCVPGFVRRLILNGCVHALLDRLILSDCSWSVPGLYLVGFGLLVGGDFYSGGLNLVSLRMLLDEGRVKIGLLLASDGSVAPHR